MNREWDVVIIGAGMGGALCARTLSEAGFQVLTVDRGLKDTATSLPSPEDDPEARLTSGLWPHKLLFDIDFDESEMYPVLGSGVGGSTLHYASALERLLRTDIDYHPALAHPLGSWPIRYDELAKYYEAAERLFEVQGTADPLQINPVDVRVPTSMSDRDRALFAHFATSGLHPYRSHMGGWRTASEAAKRGRPGRLDARDIFNRSARPIEVLDRTIIERLEILDGRVRTAEGRRADTRVQVRGRYFILAAGALHTPQILMNSPSETREGSICSRSNQLGRNLMFHALDLFLVWPNKRTLGGRSTRSVSSTALADTNGHRLGMIQSMAIDGGSGLILEALRNGHTKAKHRMFAPLKAAGKRIFLGRPTLFGAVIEDLPYAQNRVELTPSRQGLKVVYRIAPELRERIALFRERLTQSLGRRNVLMLHEEPRLNLGHACGTCRMGDDPDTSVVNADCRTHEVDNLYIADASVFRTSGRSNPSLTVAAIALRVAEKLALRLRSRDFVTGSLIPNPASHTPAPIRQADTSTEG